MEDAATPAYDDVAERYAELFLADLDRVPADRTLLDRFADLALHAVGPVADVGCGPGHVTDYLTARGVPACGYDISPAMIDVARRSFPDATYELGDLSSLPLADETVGGIVARYSLIHLWPARLPVVFDHWARLLVPGGVVLVSFFAADSVASHGSPFDHAVATAHRLCPDLIVDQLERCGFTDIEVSLRAATEGERPIGHASILARRAPSPRRRR